MKDDLIKAIMNGNIKEMYTLIVRKEDEFMEAFNYLVKNGPDDQKFYDYHLKESDLPEIIEGTKTIESRGYEYVELPMLLKIAQVVDHIERRRDYEN